MTHGRDVPTRQRLQYRAAVKGNLGEQTGHPGPDRDHGEVMVVRPSKGAPRIWPHTGAFPGGCIAVVECFPLRFSRASPCQRRRARSGAAEGENAFPESSR